MELQLSHPSGFCEGNLQITGSKSETNRLLLLQALYPNIEIVNGSASDDSVAMTKALQRATNTVDIHHAGTAMRFLTAYFSIQEGKTVELTGSSRMQERPISILVEALRSLGAQIDYVKKEGYPPLRIQGTKFNRNEVTLSAQVSSQYITALMLIAPRLPKGLSIHLEGNITSLPYLKMTQALLNELGIQARFEGQSIHVAPANKVNTAVQVVESDWSSASYFFSIVALAKQAKISLSAYKKESLQGDSGLMAIYDQLGVASQIKGQTLWLEKKPLTTEKVLELDLTTMPDIAQTIAVTCYGLGIGCNLYGLHTLKIKETDRLEALHTELTKLGAVLKVTDKSLHLEPGQHFKVGKSIATYHDHRMAMAFAPLALKVPLSIQDSGVVSKSFPTFWKDLKALQFLVR